MYDYYFPLTRIPLPLRHLNKLSAAAPASAARETDCPRTVAARQPAPVSPPLTPELTPTATGRIGTVRSIDAAGGGSGAAHAAAAPPQQPSPPAAVKAGDGAAPAAPSPSSSPVDPPAENIVDPKDIVPEPQVPTEGEPQVPIVPHTDTVETPSPKSDVVDSNRVPDDDVPGTRPLSAAPEYGTPTSNGGGPERGLEDPYGDGITISIFF